MMYDFIESKKKIFKDNLTKNTKTVQQDKGIFDTSDDIQTESSTGTFIRPWLKNNLGLSQGINSSLDWSVCLPNFTNLESSSVSYKNEEKIIDPKEKSENEVPCPKIETNQEDLKMTSIEQESVYPDAEKLKEEERRIFKLLKQKGKIKRRFSSTEDSGKCEADHLLELKAKDVIENFTRKDSSDIKECDAKFLYFKCHNEKNPKEISFQKPKDQSSKSNVEKLIESIKENSSKKIYRIPDCVGNSVFENLNKKDEVKQSFNDGGNKLNEDKESLLSTDDENDIKRFSEFLSKNKNQDEKRKCLEEVRNYFEKKRRTRFTKKRPAGDSKPPQASKREEQVKEKPKTKEVFTLLSGKDRRNRFHCYDEEIVEKAVNETLQKFVNLYHFHVSPAVMSSMRRNILKAIQSDSLDSDSSKNYHDNFLLDKSLEEPKLDKELLVEKKESEKSPERKGHQISACSNIDCVNKETKKKGFSTVVEAPVGKPSKESDALENENVKRLKKEFENFLNSIQTHADVTGLKLQSVILEKEQTSSSKTVQFVYNFKKKSLESNKTPTQVLKDLMETKPVKDVETQTILKPDVSKNNAKSQTVGCESFDKCLQTQSKICTSKDIQTESVDLMIKELKEVTSSDVSPGLYRMVKSKEVGRFYLYPENISPSSEQLFEDLNTKDSKEKLKNKPELVKFLIKNMKKDKRVVSRDGKVRLNKRGYVLASKRLQKASPTDYREADKLKSSYSCFYFKNHLPCEPALKSMTHLQASKVLDSELDNTVEETPKESHLGCVWFWNGEKITPGCDLKIHVEDLVTEKLKELTNTENCKMQLKVQDNCLQQSNTPERNLDIKNTNAMICFKRGLGPKNPASLLKGDCDGPRDECGNKKDIVKEKNCEEKSVRDVSTQNSQQIFLPLNIGNLKCMRKCNSTGKGGKTKFKKKKLILKSFRGTQRYTLKSKKIGSSGERLENLKLFQTLNDSEIQENTSCSCSVTEISTSSLTSENLVENPTPLIKDFLEAKEREGSSLGTKKLITTASCEVQTNREVEDSAEHLSQGSIAKGYQHWELIETLLKRAGQRKRESFWKDISELVGMKLGKDINDDEAQEVCIEIEQDFPDKVQDKQNHTITAKGHYKKSDVEVDVEGDVEVEIDLTLEDLEKILRSRRKKT